MSRSIRAVPVSDEVTAISDSATSAATDGTSTEANGYSSPTTEVESKVKVVESFQQLSMRLENLRQTEGLLEAALRFIMTIGWAHREDGGCFILRPDGTEVKPSDRATEMAVDRLHPLLEAITAEIVAIEGASTEKRVAYQAIIDETSSSHSPSRGVHPAGSLDQFISAMVRDAVSAEFERRGNLNRKARKNGQTGA